MTVPDPSACRWCGIPQRGHARQWTEAASWHQYEPPTQNQIRDRMTARRASKETR